MNELLPAAAIGAVAGLRAFTSPAAVGRAASLGLLEFQHPAFAQMGSARGSKILLGLALAELVGDKLPFTPSRLKPGSLIARLISGAACGAALNSSRERPVLAGAIVGAGAALGAAFAAYHLRKAFVEQGGWPDPVIALAEDAVALGTAVAATALIRPATRGPVLQGSR